MQQKRMQRSLSAILAAALSVVTAHAQAITPARAPNAVASAMLAYPLTPGKLDQYAGASRAMTALIAKEPNAIAKLKPSAADAPKTVDETVTFTKRRCPECVSAVESTGMSYREYVLFQGSLMIAYVLASRPHATSAVRVLPENLRFIQTNRAKIDGILEGQRLKSPPPK